MFSAKLIQFHWTNSTSSSLESLSGQKMLHQIAVVAQDMHFPEEFPLMRIDISFFRKSSRNTRSSASIAQISLNIFNFHVASRAAVLDFQTNGHHVIATVFDEILSLFGSTVWGFQTDTTGTRTSPLAPARSVVPFVLRSTVTLDSVLLSMSSSNGDDRYDEYRIDCCNTFAHEALANCESDFKRNKNIN